MCLGSAARRFDGWSLPSCRAMAEKLVSARVTPSEARPPWPLLSRYMRSGVVGVGHAM